MSKEKELLHLFIKEIKEEFADQNWDYLDFVAERTLSKILLPYEPKQVTDEEIKQEAELFANKVNRNGNDMARDSFIYAAKWMRDRLPSNKVIESEGYAEQEAIGFAEWLRENNWSGSDAKNHYYNNIDFNRTVSKEVSELFKLYKERK